jgi:S1-C subfamily serine protease
MSAAALDSVRRLPRRGVLLVIGLVVASIAASVGAVMALAHGTAAPTPTATPIVTGAIGSGVVLIDTDLAYQGAAAAGTGMVLTSSGKVLTNNHVISGATTIKVVDPKTGHSYKARVVGYDRTADVALLQLQGASDLKTVSISSANLSVGASVTARGNAGGDGKISSATGTVTGLGKSITASDDTGGSEHLTGLIETNAGVQPGDSGGPLVNSQGQVVGMDTAASSRFVFQDISTTDAYAVPIAKARTIADAISSGEASPTVHIGKTAFLGIAAGSVDTPGYGYGGQVASASGALIVGVVSRGPAASASLVAGDVITAINGRTVSSPTEISAFMLTKTPGTKIRVAYVDQSGTSHTASVTLGSGPAQ